MKKIYLFFSLLAFVLCLSACAGSHRSAYNTYKYGKYAKSIVSDRNLVKILADITTTNKQGYYEYDGNEYAKVTADVLDEAEVFFSDNTPVKKGKEYFFLVEPITWRIMNETDTELTLISEYVLSVTRYNQVGKDVRYDNSQLRSYLNSSFLERAFNNETKKPIKTKVGVSALGSNSIVYVEDLVWIPSADELSKENGFLHDDDKYVFTTDYSRAMGATSYLDSPNSYYYNTSPYPTRNYYSLTNNKIFCIDFFGKTMIASDDSFSHTSVRPCIKISK